MKRAIFLADSERLYAKRLNFAFLVLTLIMLATMFFAVTLWVGKTMGYDEAMREMRLVRHTEKPHPVQPVDVLSGNCLETARACYARKRLERVRAGT